jgi:hypothetical protein
LKTEDELMLLGLVVSEVVLHTLAQGNFDRRMAALKTEALDQPDIDACWEQARLKLITLLRHCQGPNGELANSKVLQAMLDRLDSAKVAQQPVH